MPGITDIGADAAQNSSPSSGNDGSDEYESTYERFDLAGAVFGKQHPATAVRGNAVALRKLYDENDPDRADVSVMLQNPSLVRDDGLEWSRVVQSDDESDDFKVVDLDDEATSVITPSGKVSDVADLEDGMQVMAVDFDGNAFYGDVLQDFDYDGEDIALKRGGSAGRSITTVLDVNGATAARTVEDDDGTPVLHDGGFPEHNGGLVEYHPNGRGEDGAAPRYARDPQLRPDVEGREVIVMVQRLSSIQPDYDGRAYWATVFADLPEDRASELTEQYASNADDAVAEDFMTELDGTEFVQLKPTDEFEPDPDLVRDTGWIEWNRPSIEELNEVRTDNGFDPYEPNTESDDE